MKLDTRRLDAAVSRWRRYERGDGRKLLEQQVRGFVRRVVAITPPASKGTTGTAAKKQGEAAIDADLRRVFAPVILKRRGGRGERHPDLAPLHASRRNKRTGRTSRGGRYHVSKKKYAAYRKTVIARVGVLASGWNAAAQRFGVSLPLWVRRHGTAGGSVSVRVHRGGVVITMRNTVGFANRVAGYERRAQAALEYQAAALDRSVSAMLHKTARRAGFRTR